MGTGILLGELGLVEIVLTDKEEQVLARPVNVNDILVKPQGQPYIPHIVYTRWFNEAFGRFGWAMVPVGDPQKTANGKKVTVVSPYVLYIHGRPVKFAWGEQDYFEGNADQTYGDALESTVASAMRRLAKRMGVSLEMWDRRYLEAFVDTRCVRVQVKQKDGTFKWQVRLKGGAPLPFEVKGNERGSSRRRDQQQPERSEAPADYYEDVGLPGYNAPAGDEPRSVGRGSTIKGEDRATHADEGEKITLAQRQRLAMIVNNSDRSDEEVNAWLRAAYNIDNVKPTRDILRRDYDAICKALEAPGRLPQGRAK